MLNILDKSFENDILESVIIDEILSETRGVDTAMDYSIKKYAKNGSGLFEASKPSKKEEMWKNTMNQVSDKLENLASEDDNETMIEDGDLIDSVI